MTGGVRGGEARRTGRGEQKQTKVIKNRRRVVTVVYGREVKRDKVQRCFPVGQRTNCFNLPGLRKGGTLGKRNLKSRTIDNWKVHR